MIIIATSERDFLNAVLYLLRFQTTPNPSYLRRGNNILFHII